MATANAPLDTGGPGLMFIFLVNVFNYALDAVNEGSGKKIGSWYYPLAKYVYVTAALVALIAGAILGGIG